MKLYPIRDAIAGAAAVGIKDAGKAVLVEALERVPVDDGILRRSGRVRADDLDVTVRFVAPHAWLQHEKTEYEHPNGGEAKYLENASLAVDVGSIVAGHVQAVIRG